jgi:DNA-binding NarL/FixJ family response regulator
LHAEPDAVAARLELRRAVSHFEEARGALRSQPEDALDRWRPLVAARWTLLDEFQQGGKRYIVARRNEPTTASLESLAPRERQALALLALGHSNKLIAYELGIAASTVSVLLHRASTKLGVRSRSDLAQIARRLALPR